MEMMAQDNKNLKQKIIDYIKRPYFCILVAFLICLYFVCFFIRKELKSNIIENDSEVNNIDVLTDYFYETDDERLLTFVKKYFDARNHLDFVNIYRSFNKDYMVLKNTKESLKYDNGILYEKNYVSGYNNIQVFEYRGMKENEKVVLITYNMKFYFSKESIPCLLIGYVVYDNKKIYFKDNYDIAESKYINNILDREDVNALYNNIKERLELALQNDSSLRLAYNTMRQYDMNPNNNMILEKQKLLDKIFVNDYLKEENLIDLARKKEVLDE